MMINTMKKYTSIALVVAGVGAFANLACAAEFDYPVDNLRLFVPAAPGGGTDQLAREYAREFEALTGTSVAVVNQSGGGGVSAFQSVVNARPDGGTLLFYHSALHVASNTGRSPYSFEDMKPLATLGDLNEIYAVSADAPYSTINELLDYLKNTGERLTMGVQMGAGTQLKGQALSEAAGGQIRIVDAGSEGQRVPMLLGGQLDISVISIANGLQYEESGDIKVLAVVSDKQDPAAPHWPTTVSQGLDVSLPLVFTLYGQKELDSSMVETLDEVNGAIMERDSFQQGMTRVGVVPSYRDAEEAFEFVSQEEQKVSGLLE
ncbi:tripartite tricarboxylate transporter substrate binding protein [Halomonas sp.]|uniref:tripartite tricarboxylate transporter substrate binding protein n=1 Tax=Halomonas sp. TaxID=1486246 RepID=UPI003A92A8C3